MIPRLLEGDWSIFRRESVFCEQTAGRKHGPVPFPSNFSPHYTALASVLEYPVMSTPAFTRAQSRLVDQIAVAEYGFSGLVLMENAGRGAADVLCRLGIDGPVVVCCGKGNNAGDGLVIARHLDLRGHAVRVLLWADPKELSGDAGANFQILAKTDVPIEVFGSSHAEGFPNGVPLLGTSSAECNPAAKHCLFQAVAHHDEKCRLEKLLDGAAWIVDALLGTGARRAASAA